MADSQYSQSSGTYYASNKAENGGAVAAITDSTFANSTASLFALNEAIFSGGAVFGDSRALLQNMTYTLFLGNKALSGGAVLVTAASRYLSAHACTYCENTAEESGGGI